jgi:hypothetical protein
MGNDKSLYLAGRKCAEISMDADGKTYFVDPDGNSEEVVVCPFCKMIVYVPDQAERSDCKHIAFLYDLANRQFAEMDDEFKRQHPVFDLEAQSKVPGLKTYEWNDHWGIGGVIWGFWNPENRTSNQNEQPWILGTTLGAKEKHFEWRVDDNCFLSIRRRFELKTGSRIEEKTISPNEIGQINNLVSQGWCCLANNVKKLRAGTEKDGIGSFLYNTLGWNETDSQLASQLAALFTKAGVWHYDSKKINMQFKAIQSDWCKCLQDYSSKSV